MARLIDADVLETAVLRARYHDNQNEDVIWELVQNAPTVDAVPVVHGRWKLEAFSFYMDTLDYSLELAVYILASCNECNGRHPDHYEVFSKTLYAPEDADKDFRFDEESERAKALAEFMQSEYRFANYCPNCGAKMDGDGDG